jgi:membrane protein YqaA with SNARE-associated domain
MRLMTEWFEAATVWLRSWMSADWGLIGLFLSAFLSATVLPGSSEVVMVAFIAAHPSMAWVAFAVAMAGNLLGCLLTFGMGGAAHQGYDRFRRVQVNTEGPQMQRLRRWGPPALLLSLLPLVGDALVLAAGWLRLPLLHCLAWIALGKGLRYLAVVLSMKGLLSFV